MSDRRPEKAFLSSREGIVYRTLRDAQLGDLEQAALGDLEQAARDVITALHLAGQLSESDPVSAVRRGVESGTIAGGIVDTDSRAGFWLADHLNQFPPKTYLVIEVEQR